MSDLTPATADAGELLYSALQALEAQLAKIDYPANASTREIFLRSVKILAVWIAQGDDRLSTQECTAINQIFLQDPDSWSPWTTKDNVDQQPALFEEAVTYVQAAARLMSSFAEEGQGPVLPNSKVIYKALELVCQTVLAADESETVEVDRLTELLGRIRKGLVDEPAASNQPAAPAADAPTLPPPAALTPLAAAMAELDQLIGLETVKREVQTLTNLAKVFQIRRKMGLPVPPMSFHVVFLGNPGTGKTTVARIIARIYGALGLLSKGQLIEVDRSGLVANYIGQTATKVSAAVESALGGVLFIDEAYALDGNSDNDFGHEAVATLIKAMEDHRADLVVIAAGYTKEMQRFLDINPGIRSRMGREITFPDYAPSELAEIFKGMVAQAGYTISASADPQIGLVFQDLWDRRGKDFANARDVRNLFERLIEAQANRVCMITSPTEAEVKAIANDDLLSACAPNSNTA